ncbi:MAG: endonuclease IV [Thermoplasmatales archaeon]|nr:endonuclease IV [Thermoplasmatales archaeon]
MIRFGPAGIPLSCKGRTLTDGIEDVHNLSLTAMQIPMILSSVMERPADYDDEVGRTLMEFEEDAFVVEIIRDGESIFDVNEPIEEDDTLVQAFSWIANRTGDLFKIGKMARRLDVSLSMRTPHYIDLGSNHELTDDGIANLQRAAFLTDALGGSTVVTNLGVYTGELPDDEIDGNIRENVAGLMEWWKDCGFKPRLGIEITGHEQVFGSVEQVLELCGEIDGLVPVVNFANHHARTAGGLFEADDFADLVDMVSPYSGGRVHTIFSGVEYGGPMPRLTPIKKGDLKFETFAEYLVDARPELDVISASPLLEHDAMYMRVIYERVLNRMVAKRLRQQRKEAEEAAKAAAAEEKE